MSLVVTVYKITHDAETGERKTEKVNDSMPIGGESWRWGFYGCAEAKALGLKLIPTLAEGDIYAEGDDLDVLEQDVRLMQEKLLAIVSVPSEMENYAKRLGYILEAVELAKRIQGQVYLW